MTDTQQTPTTTATGIAVETDEHPLTDTDPATASPPDPAEGVLILNYGQARSAGTITCDSEPSGMTCTDSSTGHYFRMSRESNELG